MRLTLLISLLFLAALVTGALATTSATFTVEPSELWRQLVLNHRMLARPVSVTALLVLLWLGMRTVQMRKLAMTLAAGVAIVASLGEMPNGVVGWGGLVHATVAQLLLAGAVGLVVMSTRIWTGEAQKIQDYGWPSLRSLAITLPVLVTIQVMLGAAFRQRMLGLMPHIIGAMLVSLFILMVSAFVLQQCKGHKVLEVSARVLMVTTFLQVFLGMGVFGVRSMAGVDQTIILAVVAVHIAVGALLLAASVVLGMNIRRNVTPKVPGAVRRAPQAS